MAECTVYTPCGRYIVHFKSNAQQQRLWLDVCPNNLRPRPLHSAPSSSAPCSNATTPGILWGACPHSPLSSAPSSLPAPPLHLVASLDEADVVALTASAGVRKNFANFSRMLYDALIGRSTCVHFYVETVAEMKERIQRDVRLQQQQQGRSSSSAASSSPASQPALGEKKVAGNNRVNLRLPAAITTGDATSGAAAAINHAKKNGSNSSGDENGNESPARVCAAVGDTVIELDADIADEVLEQRFLTVDYDVDFTRAIFPIPLTEAAATAAASGEVVHGAATLCAASGKSAASDAEAEEVARELRSTLERVTSLEAENARLRRENAALVQLSKQKMQEMQRLCDDFEQRVRDAAEADKLRATNASLRAQLQEAIEERQTVLRTLERERSQRRLIGPSALSTAALRGSGERERRSLGGGRRSNSNPSSSSSAARRRALGHQGENPYLRSLSRDSTRSSGNDAKAHSRRSSVERGYQRRCSSSSSARLDRHGRPLLSPTPTPTSRQRRVPTRFDTPPGPSTQRVPCSGRRISGDSFNSGHGGDSPAPRDRTGGRQNDAAKPRRSLSGSSRGNGEWRSSPSVPRRGPSLWTDTSEHPSPRGSVASSRCSSASHERLYRATTASSRQHQTPKASALAELGARRAVFH